MRFHCTLHIFALQEVHLLYIGLTRFITVSRDTKFYIANSELKKLIGEDITMLRRCSFHKMSGHWSAAQKFRRVNFSYMSILGMLHAVTLTLVIYRHTTQSDPGPLCTDASHNHYIYLPFFCDNVALLAGYERLLQIEGEPHKEFIKTHWSGVWRSLGQGFSSGCRQCTFPGWKTPWLIPYPGTIEHYSYPYTPKLIDTLLLTRPDWTSWQWTDLWISIFATG